MSRSTNIDTYSAAERGLLSPAFIEALPHSLPPFPTRKAAMGARIAIYGLIGAARRSAHTHEVVASYQLGVSMPFEQPDGTWIVTLFNKDAGGAPSQYQSAIEHALRSTIGAVPQPPTLAYEHRRPQAGPSTAALQQSAVPSSYAPAPSQAASPTEIEAAVRAAGLLRPNEPFIASEWTQTVADEGGQA